VCYNDNGKGGYKMDKRIEVAKKMGLFFSRISPQIKGNLLQY
jgi:hypothetical protein